MKLHNVQKHLCNYIPWENTCCKICRNISFSSIYFYSVNFFREVCILQKKVFYTFLIEYSFYFCCLILRWTLFTYPNWTNCLGTLTMNYAVDDEEYFKEKMRKNLSPLAAWSLPRVAAKMENNKRLIVEWQLNVGKKKSLIFGLYS